MAHNNKLTDKMPLKIRQTTFTHFVVCLKALNIKNWKWSIICRLSCQTFYTHIKHLFWVMCRNCLYVSNESSSCWSQPPQLNGLFQCFGVSAIGGHFIFFFLRTLWLCEMINFKITPSLKTNKKTPLCFSYFKFRIFNWGFINNQILLFLLIIHFFTHWWIVLNCRVSFLDSSF